MSGKRSRARRVEASNAARDAVYARSGAPYSDGFNLFTCPRQRRIFEGQYTARWAEYWRMESLREEMEQVYGGRRE